MKTVLTLLVVSFVFLGLHGQEVDINGLYSSSSTKEFKNSIGIGLGYNYFVNHNRIGIALSYLNYNTAYDDIYTSTTDGTSIIVKEINPNNNRMSINLNYAYRIIDNSNSIIWLGCTAGLNYFNMQGDYYQYDDNLQNKNYLTYDYKESNRIGIGLLIEYEITNIFSDRFSSSIKINPELTSFDDFASSGGHAPWLIGWINFSVGLKYRFDK